MLYLKNNGFWQDVMDATPAPDSRKAELLKFVFLAFVFIPALSVGVVAAYGFAVWIYQMFAGPPGM
jgi:nitrate reductase NapE